MCLLISLPHRSAPSLEASRTFGPAAAPLQTIKTCASRHPQPSCPPCSCPCPPHWGCLMLTMSQPRRLQPVRSPSQGSWARPACRSVPQSRQRPVASTLIHRLETHLPLRDTQIHLSTALGGKSLVVLQASAHDAAGDGEVSIVAVNARFRSSAPHRSPVPAQFISSKKSIAWSMGTHVRPAAFHANVILAV